MFANLDEFVEKMEEQHTEKVFIVFQTIENKL